MKKYKIRHKDGTIKEVFENELGNYGLVPEAKSGIKIKPSKKGTFKAQATKMGMGVQEAASKILNAPEGKYSPEMRKKANFAKNFAKQDGGEIEYNEEEFYYPYMEEEMKSGGMIKRADGSYSKRGLWDNIRANKGSGKKPTKAMLKQEKKIKAAEKAYGGYMEDGGGIDNPGFNALPNYVQQNIIDNMAMGGYMESGGKLPTEILRARLESHMSPNETNDYLSKYEMGGYMQNGGNIFKTKYGFNIPKAQFGFQARDEGYDPQTGEYLYGDTTQYYNPNNDIIQPGFTQTTSTNNQIIPKGQFNIDPSFTPFTNNKYFDRAFRYLDQSKNFATNAINNLTTGEKDYNSVLKYNGNIPVTNYNKGIKVNNKVVGSDFKRPQEESYVMQPLDIQPIKKYGGTIPKAQFGAKPPFAQDSPQNNQYQFDKPFSFTPFDPGDYEPMLSENSQFYNPNGQFNNFNLGTGDNSPVYEAPSSINMAKDKNTFNISDINKSDVGYNTLNFIGAGVNNTLAGINMGKGMLDMIGNDRQNKMEQQRNAEQFTQSVFNSEEFSTPYESRGYGFQGRNALAENGMQIKDIGGYGQPNIEAESGEMVKTPEGFAQTLQGKTHEEGGIPLNLKPETKIFSDHLKDPITKKTYSKLAKPFETKKDFDRLNNKKADDIQRKTSELMISFKDQKLDELFDIQEMDKISGKHGAKIQLEAIENQQPMAKYGMELPKAQEGMPVKDKDYKSKAKKSSIDEVKQKGYNFIDQEGNKFYYGKEGELKKLPGKGSNEFNKAFAQARKENKKTFNFNGKLFTTDIFKGSVTPQGEYVFVEETPKIQPIVKQNPQTPTEPKIEYRDRVETQYLQPNMEANMNIPAYIPNNYGRLPLNFYDLNPEFIDPRYLDIQPQLNQVLRGQRAFQNNLGSRTSSDMSNLLQSQVNAYNQNQNIYGQKYNYDRGQDAQAQQFNAQAVMNTDQYNQSAWYNQLEDPIRRREGALSTQQLKDNITSQENASNATAFYNNLDYIQNEVPYYNKLNKDQFIEALNLYVEQQDPYKITKKTTTKKTEDGTEKTEVSKYGGKVKIKPKLKKK
jgi:hypothetical protein